MHTACLFLINYFVRVNGGCFCDHIFFKSIYRRGKKKSTPLVMNNSNLESQTVALVVTGRSWLDTKIYHNLKDLPVVNIFVNIYIKKRLNYFGNNIKRPARWQLRTVTKICRFWDAKKLEMPWLENHRL